MSQPGNDQAPEWVRQLHSEPEWVKSLSNRNVPPPRVGNTGGTYEAGRQDQELLTAIRSMPEQVVNALRSAIEAATPQQTPAPQPQTQQNASGQNPTGQNSPQTPEPAAAGGTAPPTDTAPRAAETFADKWFGNKLFT